MFNIGRSLTLNKDRFVCVVVAAACLFVAFGVTANKHVPNDTINYLPD